jgi:hypothetical protein
MSRGQSTQAFNTASNENATDFGNAQSAFGSTEDAIGNYNNQLAKFVSGNPYTPGGEYDQTINTGLTNVSDAGANSLAGALQAQARRTGQNSAADAATAAAGAQQNTRDLSGDLAAAQQKRIAGEAGYNRWARRDCPSAPTNRCTAPLRMRRIVCWAMKPMQPRRRASGIRSAAASPATWARDNCNYGRRSEQVAQEDSVAGRGTEPGAASTRSRPGKWPGRIHSDHRQPGETVAPGAGQTLCRGLAGRSRIARPKQRSAVHKGFLEGSGRLSAKSQSPPGQADRPQPQSIR